MTGYRAYRKLKLLMEAGKISGNIKIKVYKIDIRPAVLYTAEINKEEEKLTIFERKIVRRIYGHKKVENDKLRPPMNFEMAELLEGEDIVKLIKLMRIRLYGQFLIF